MTLPWLYSWQNIQYLWYSSCKFSSLIIKLLCSALSVVNHRDVSGVRTNCLLSERKWSVTHRHSSVLPTVVAAQNASTNSWYSDDCDCTVGTDPDTRHEIQYCCLNYRHYRYWSTKVLMMILPIHEALWLRE